MKFRVNKFAKFWKICEKVFLSEKNPTSSCKIGGFGRQKIIRKSFQTSVIISFKKEKNAISALLRKTFFSGKYSNFNFQNRGYFVKKNDPQIS